MRSDQPPRPSPSIVPSPERVAAFMAEQRARADQEVAAAFGLTKSAAVPQLIWARPTPSACPNGSGRTALPAASSRFSAVHRAAASLLS